jgi:hypothetical protein
MRRNEFIRVISICALMMLPFVGSGLTASLPRAIHQACSGVLTLEDGYYELTPDAGSGLWCDANVAEELEGSIRGHGIFYWTRISSITRLE